MLNFLLLVLGSSFVNKCQLRKRPGALIAEPLVPFTMLHTSLVYNIFIFMDMVLGGLAILLLVFLMLVHFLEWLPTVYESIANTEETPCVLSCCHVGCSKPRFTRSATHKPRSARAALIQYNWKLVLGDLSYCRLHA